MELHSDKTFNCGADHEKKHEMMLDLSLSAQKSDNLFADSDQTPTPTRLIRNCEEVGLFEDLRHVNPFEETFRRAVEQNTGQTPSSQLPESVDSHTNEDSLHTPQVFPQLEAGAGNCEMGAKPLDSPPSAAVTLDVPAVDELLRAATDDAFKLSTSRQNSNNSTTSSGGYGKFHKYRCSVEKSTITSQTMVTTSATNANTTTVTAASIGTPSVVPLGTMCTLPATADATSLPFVQLPTIQLLQPQVITLTFPDNVNVDSSKTRTNVASTQGIPVQTVKPFIMPKLAPASSGTSAAATSSTPSGATQQALLPRVTTNSERLEQQPLTHEPSSASLTPTSQLPIKERLKVKLSHNKAQRPVEVMPPKKSAKRVCDEDCAVRRRAAASRYRNKMRNEHKELKRRNAELEADNEKLRIRVKQLEGEMSRMQQQTITPAKENGNVVTMPAKIQIPSTTLQMIMNIPTMVVPAMGQPTLMQPLTYRIERK